MSDRLPVAVLGASGYVGQHFVRMLADHPEFEVVALTGGTTGRGKRISDLWQISERPPDGTGSLRLEATSAARLARAGVRVAFSALPSGTAGRIETELRRRGVHVFSNAADHRREASAPLLVPEVNGSHLVAIARPGRTLLVNNPNCTATGLALGLAPVWSALRPRAVHVTTYQALSGAGFPGISSLASTDNVVPYIPDEEEKVGVESRHLLGAVEGRGIAASTVPIVAQCARVPVRDGHLEAVTVEARARPTLAELRDAWDTFDPLKAHDLPTAPHPPVVRRNEPDRPQPIRDRWAGDGRAAGMTAVVGRIRWEPPYLRCFVLSHNAVRGGAGGSVLNAEYARAVGYLPA